MKFKLDTTEGIILSKAKIANRKQSIFIKIAVDTGASFTMISIEAALAIGINPSKSMRHIEITTANGIVFVPVIKIPSFKCFGVELKNIEAVCHNLPPESCVEGLLGLNFLKGAKVIIDFSKNIIEVINTKTPYLDKRISRARRRFRKNQDIPRKKFKNELR